MKLLDPFSGYRLASCHPFFHLGLFICSFIVPFTGKDDINSTEKIERCFNLLRYAHAILIIATVIDYFLRQPSEIHTKANTAVRDIKHRDSHKIAFASTLEILTVFTYQGIMFYCQMVLSEEIWVKVNDGANTHYSLQAMDSNRMTWLLIEAACFYCYMLSAMTYLLYQSFRSCLCSATPIQDRRKALTDFISFSYYNMTWFALSFVLCIMPIICRVLTSYTLEFPNHN